MNHPRETIASAFFALFSGIGGGTPFTTVSRVLEVPQNVDPTQVPAYFAREDREGVSEVQVRGMPAYKMRWTGVIYAVMPDLVSGIAPGSVLNPLLDAVDKAVLSKPPGEAQQLGGLVLDAYLDGEILKSENYLGQYIVAVLPFSILTGI